LPSPDQRFRGWHLIAALAAISAIGVFIAIRSTGGGPDDAAGLASYLPKREAAIAFVNVSAIRSSGLLDKLVGSTVGEEAEYKTFVQRTGFNYKTDLDRVLMSSASGVHYFLLKGRFDWNKLRSYAMQEGGKCDGDYCSVAGSTPGRVISFHRAKSDLMALASAGTDSAARDIVKHSPEKLSFDVPDKPVWLHAPASMMRDQRETPAGTRLFLKALEQAESLMMTIGPAGDAFEVAINVICRAEQDAAVLRAQLEQITTLLQKFLTRENQRANAADLSGVLASGSFQRDGRHVLGRWPLQKEFIQSLSKGL
jgi:hypothetical protein